MFNLEETAVDPRKEEIFHRLMTCVTVPIYVLGRNKYAERVSRVVEVRAFIDDFTEQSSYMGRPVIRTTALPHEGIVVSCAAYNPCTTIKRLESIGAGMVIDYFTLSRLAPIVFPLVDFCAENRQDILQNASRYEWVYSLLTDDISKDHFTRIVQFRLTMDVEHMRGFSPIRDRQYFEEFVPLKQGEVFVDAGGYDGLTSRQYAMWNPGYRKIYYFEPVPAMMEVSRRNLMSVRDVHFVQKALFSRNDKLRFDASCGERSWISAGGQTEVEAVSLDEEVPEPVTFIKMDIEGAEYEAILGATEHIKSDVPTLAICIYHTQQHFWQVPLRVLELSDCYRLYVRHYSEGVVDTVMFFVPKREQNRG